MTRPLTLALVTTLLTLGAPSALGKRAGRLPPPVMLIATATANLYGHPQPGAVLGILREGEGVQLVNRTGDRKWVEVDIGGGENAWVNANAFRPGRKIAKSAPVVRGVPVAQLAPAARVAPVAQLPPSPVPKASPQPDAEAVPVSKPPLVRSPESSVAMQAPARSDGSSVFVGAQAGVAFLRSRFASNGASARGYEYGALAASAQATIGFVRKLGRRFSVGLDGRYVYAGAMGVPVAHSNGPADLWNVRAHDFGLTLAPGVHFDARGGIDLKLRIGVEGIAEQTDPAGGTVGRLPENILLGLGVGVALNFASLFSIAQRPVGLSLSGGALTPARLLQTAGLADGARSRAIGASAGARVSFGLLRPSRRSQLSLDASYGFAMLWAHFEGACPAGQSCRDASVTVADRGSFQHLIGLGLAYVY